jgi:fucose permease
MVMIGFQTVTAVTVSGAFVVGMVLVLLANIRLFLAKRFNLSEGGAEWLLSMVNLSLIPMMLLSGILIDKLGVKNVLLVGSLVMAVAVFLLAISETASRALGAVLVAGAGAACLSTGSSVLMRDAFFVESEAASQNLGNVFFGLGALLTPTLSELLLERLAYRRALTVVGLACLLPAVMAAFTVRDAFPERTQGDLTIVLGSPVLWLAGMVFFLYEPLERLLGSWTTQYLTEVGYGSRGAAWLVTGFWLAFLASRLGTALLQWQYPPSRNQAAWLIVGLGVVAGVVLGNLAGARRRLSVGLGWIIVGAILGPIFPTLVAVVFYHFPDARGTAYGAMFGLGAIGNLFLPSLIGTYARRTTVHRAMLVPMILALSLALAAFVLGIGWAG